MTGGVGFSRDASANFDYNRKQIKREEAFGRMKKNLYHGKEDLRKNYPQLTEAKRKALREAYLKEKRREDRLKWAVFTIVSLAAVITCLLLIL